MLVFYIFNLVNLFFVLSCKVDKSCLSQATYLYIVYGNDGSTVTILGCPHPWIPRSKSYTLSCPCFLLRNFRIWFSRIQKLVAIFWVLLGSHDWHFLRHMSQLNGHCRIHNFDSMEFLSALHQHCKIIILQSFTSYWNLHPYPFPFPCPFLRN